MTIPTKIFILLGLAAPIMIGPAVAQRTHGAVSRMAFAETVAAASGFTDKAAQASMMELDLGKVAMNKAANTQVRRFAQRMVDDHSKFGDELRGIATKDNLVIPDQVDANDQAIIDHLSHLSGDAFDRAYLRQMVMDHEKSVMLFQQEASDGGNADVKTWAAATLPTLQDHLREARETESRLVGGSF